MAHAQQLSTLRASAAYRRDGQVQQQDGLWLDNRMGNAELTSTSGSEITPAGVTSPFGLPRSGREVTRGRHPSPVPRNRLPLRPSARSQGRGPCCNLGDLSPNSARPPARNISAGATLFAIPQF